MNSIWALIQENWVGTILGLIALVIALYEMLKRRGPKLSYQFSGQRIVGRRIDPLPAQVSIQFEGEPVDHLSRTEIILWNAGPAALRRNDIPQSDPLTIQFQDSRILMTEITKVVRESSDVSITVAGDRSSATVSFEYLDKNDGALLTLWHDGVDTTPAIRGVIIGQRGGVTSTGRFVPNDNPDIPRSTPVGSVEKIVFRYTRILRYLRFFVPWMPIVIGFLLVIGSLFQHQLQAIIPFLYVDEPNRRTMLLGVVLGTLYMIPGIFILRLYSRKFPKELIPPQFAPSSSSVDEQSE